jgi:hypothetical protein
LPNADIPCKSNLIEYLSNSLWESLWAVVVMPWSVYLSKIVFIGMPATFWIVNGKVRHDGE